MSCDVTGAAANVILGVGIGIFAMSYFIVWMEMIGRVRFPMKEARLAEQAKKKQASRRH